MTKPARIIRVCGVKNRRIRKTSIYLLSYYLPEFTGNVGREKLPPTGEASSLPDHSDHPLPAVKFYLIFEPGLAVLNSAALVLDIKTYSV